MLKIGSAAPSFTLEDHTGKKHSLADYAGKKVVVYFYPRDNTPGCTIEAKEFSERIGEFKKRNTVIIGISKDSASSHDAFICEYDLKVILLSDPENAVIERFGAWREKKNYSKTYMGIVRSTVLIDEKGIILKIWDAVNAKGHAEEVLGAV
jgi:peroxiredoxin Q/BCP